MNEKIKELEAMIIVLLKRVEKLEGKQKMYTYNTLLDELRKDAQKLVSNS